jgi:hypothetical protein
LKKIALLFSSILMLVGVLLIVPTVAPVYAQAGPTITTTLSSGAVPVGFSVYDNATLQGATANAGGTVSYTVFTNGACVPLGNIVSVVTVTNGAVPGSRRVFFNSSGTFSWQAMYSGDSNNSGATSSCEPVTTCRCTTTIATTLTATTINPGGSVSDSATLGAFSAATGTVTYSLYSTGVCLGTSNTVSIVTVTNNVVPSSRPVIFNSIGSFSWVASYSGDAGNPGATSACEPMSVVSPNFAMIATPSSLTLIAGSSGTSTITLSSLDGFNGMVSLSTSPPPLCPSPQCSTWSITPSSVALNPNGRANATLTIFSGTQAISERVTVFGNSSNLSHSVNVTFTVVTPDFTITANPSSQSVSRGSSTSFALSVTGTNGFNGTVKLSASTSPLVRHGPSTSLPSMVGPYSTSTLTAATSRNTPIGMYTITVTATSGLLIHTVTVTVIVRH